MQTGPAASLITAYRFPVDTLARNLEGIDDVEAAWRPETGANSIHWLLGHLLTYRDRTHALLGLPPAWPASLGDPEPYKRGHDGSLSQPVPLAALRTALDASQAAVLSALGRLTSERLAEPVNEKSTVGEQLGFLAFHEGYHAGQVAILRRLLGKEGAI